MGASAAIAGGAAELLLVLLLFLAPLPNGCLLEGPGDARWQTLLDAGLFAIFLLVLLEVRLRGRRLRRPVVWLPMALLVALLGLQVVPLPIGVVDAVSPTAAAFARGALPEAPAIATLSVAPQLTLLEALRLASLLAVIVVVVNRFRTMAACVRLAIWITAVAVAMTVLAFYLRATSEPFVLLRTWELRRWGTPFGPYINKNHFAGLAEIGLGASLALVLRALSDLHERTGGLGLRVTLAEAFGRNAPRLLLPLGAFAVIGAGLVASLSRGGWIATGIAGGALFAWLIVSGRAQWVWKPAILLVLLVAGAAAVLGPGRIEARFQVQGRAVNRPRIWMDAVDLWADFPVVGAGAGTFLYAFQPYHSFPDRRLATHAEMDWLQFLTGFGLLGLALVAWAIVRFVRRVAVGIRSAQDPPPGAEGDSLFVGGVLTGVAALAIHGFLDVNLQIPANALHFVVLAGLGLAATAAVDRRAAPLLVVDGGAPEAADREVAKR